MTQNKARDVKLVAAGDGSVGKTCLLMTYAYNKFSEGYVPTVFDTYDMELLVEGQSISLGLWDTAGQEDYDRLRPLSYSNAHVFIACFNLTNQDSLTHIEEKWVPELRHYGRKVPIILVGCKKDLRKNKGSKEEVSTSEGMRMSRKLKCAGYMECSAKTMDGVNAVFDLAIKAVICPESCKQKSICKIL